VNERRMTPALAVLAALFAAAAVLIVVEFGMGAASAGKVNLADPCVSHSFPGSGFDATVQQIVLDGLDGAACQLHTSREELVLSLRPGLGFSRKWDQRTIETAVRSGLLRAVDEAGNRGDIPGFLVGPIQKLVETIPLERLIEGGFKLQDLLP
jgi:hypothetical protein